MKRYYYLLKNISNWWLHFLVKWNLTRADPLVFQTRNQVRVSVPRRIHHEFKEIYLENAYFCGMPRRLPPSPVIVDVGANVGFFSLLAASRHPAARIYAFEPIPNNFQQLEHNAGLNSHIHLNCFQQAVGSRCGHVKMFYRRDDSFSTIASVLTNLPVKDYPHSIEVPCTTLEKIFERNGLDHCDLLKLDCEGAEHELLYACPPELLRRIGHMAVEVHQGDHPDHNLQTLKAFLAHQGMALYQDAGTPHMLYAWQTRTGE